MSQTIHIPHEGIKILPPDAHTGNLDLKLFVEEQDSERTCGPAPFPAQGNALLCCPLVYILGVAPPKASAHVILQGLEGPKLRMPCVPTFSF